MEIESLFPYPIHVAPQIDTLVSALTAAIDGKPFVIITDENVASHYLAPLKQAIGRVSYLDIVLPPGEGTKSLSTASHIIDQLAQANFPRDGHLLALGGGMIGDLTGFVASVYQRGIAYWQLPTTLLAQVDAAIGGKTGVNHPRQKNFIGTVYPPQGVFIATNTLKTLPERQIRSAFAECIKYAMLTSEARLEWLSTQMEAIFALDEAVLNDLLVFCCQTKADYVVGDENDHHQRQFLNLGHTFGHAIETATQYQQYTHGEAVAIGLRLAVALSCRLGWMDKAAVLTLNDLLQKANLPIHYDQALSTDELLLAMQCDKKVRDNSLRFVLLKDWGHAVIQSDIADKLIQDVLSPVEGVHYV
jgi:3-dehydroquinate synthase